MGVDAEIQLAAVAIRDLGDKIEQHRNRVFEIVKDMVALDRSGSKFRIDHVRVYAGGAGYRFFFEGPVLRKDGSSHARTRGSSPLELLIKLGAD